MFAQEFFDKSDKYHNKLITLLYWDSVTNVMAAWIDSKLWRRTQVVDGDWLEIS